MEDTIFTKKPNLDDSLISMHQEKQQGGKGLAFSPMLENDVLRYDEDQDFEFLESNENATQQILEKKEWEIFRDSDIITMGSFFMPGAPGGTETPKENFEWCFGRQDGLVYYKI